MYQSTANGPHFHFSENIFISSFVGFSLNIKFQIDNWIFQHLKNVSPFYNLRCSQWRWPIIYIIVPQYISFTLSAFLIIFYLSFSAVLLWNALGVVFFVFTWLESLVLQTSFLPHALSSCLLRLQIYMYYFIPTVLRLSLFIIFVFSPGRVISFHLWSSSYFHFHISYVSIKIPHLLFHYDIWRWKYLQQLLSKS